MIFSLVSSAQEWLNVRWDDHKQEEADRAEEKLKEYEEAERVCVLKWFLAWKSKLNIPLLEQKRFEGTRVTVETFLAWRNQFEIDTGVTARREKASYTGSKLTGKELFLRDNTLIDSDLKFLLEAGESLENVKIDEALFQNLDDLELDSDDEDEDYVPGKDF